MKKLFVLGDSISIHYGPYLEKMLAGKWEYYRKGYGGVEGDLDYGSGMNGGDSNDCLNYLLSLNDAQWEFDVLLLNCGLHDIKTVDGVRQCSEAEYKANLEKMVDLAVGKGKQVVFLTSTPVDDELHNSRNAAFKRYIADLKCYNEIAEKVMAEKGVPVVDLFGFTNSLKDVVEGELFDDHVHFVEPVRKMHAAFIAGWLMGNIGK